MSSDIPKLDSSLKTVEERVALVKQICLLTPENKLTPYYCEIMSNYILEAISREDNNRYITTDNRLKTINKRETSFQGLAEKLENGEDGLYNMMSESGKGAILEPKKKITEEEIEMIPELKQLVEDIHSVEEQIKNATGKRRCLLNQHLIQMRRDQYIIRGSYKQPIYCTKLTKSFNKLDLSEKIKITDTYDVVSDGIITLFNPKHVSALLCNYSTLKGGVYGKFSSDAYYLMMDFDMLIDKTLKQKHPLYYELIQLKWMGYQNIEIQSRLEQKFGIKHSVEYISSLWRNKIPKMLAEQAQEDYLLWYYTEQERGKWKKCSRCGQIKLACGRFFSKNTSSKDHLYSICKQCRNKK